MTSDLLSLAQNAMGNDFATAASGFLGESSTTTKSALGALLPVVIAGIAQKGATANGATGLMSLLNNPSLDTGMLGNLGGMFSGGAGAGIGGLLKAGTSTLVPALFGDKSGGLVNALASSTGIKSSSASNLLAMAVPIVLTLLKKFVGERGLDAGSLASLLGSQGANLQGKVDAGLARALGFANPGAMLAGLGEGAAEGAHRAAGAIAGGAATAGSTAMSAGGAAAAAGATGLAKWWPWLLGVVVLAFLWWLFAPKAPGPAPAPSASTSAAQPAKAAGAATAAFPAKVYFDSGSAAVSADGSKTITAVADAIKRDSLKASITGYTDKTGDAAKNEALAKTRAVAVRDALTAAGVAESSIEMKPPLFVEVGAGTTDAEARRVEINRQ